MLNQESTLLDDLLLILQKRNVISTAEYSALHLAYKTGGINDFHTAVTDFLNTAKVAENDPRLTLSQTSMVTHTNADLDASRYTSVTREAVKGDMIKLKICEINNRDSIRQTDAIWYNHVVNDVVENRVYFWYRNKLLFTHHGAYDILES